ncbi:MAG TPA: NlpC/P60 family protein [Phycisphaerae bacterium]|nr:NlpC/P60 family protein [Phycisphaerae bacterium]HOJ75336.1 NlpC/P60 family protein [Phycisphaerae bacterium]HOM52575.1 NlpC/P60 family protein [Phycisphaerae bacterium]HPP27848.1 NlpC/P60 family protein [Phycisphaerae bacterium]HPU27554.1 NlpC/P60 family protein [Phycisphaerae bacterium]
MNRATRTGLVGGLALILITGSTGKAADAALDPQIAKAIESFQPFWMPGTDELKGWRVVIHAEGGAATDPDARAQDDLCLWTASHLYHLVRDAGGYPSLPRPDDRPARQSFDPTQSAPRRCIFVRIVTSPGPDVMVAPATDGEASRRLAAAVARVGFKLDKSLPVVTSTQPAVTVMLAKVDPRLAKIGQIPAHRAWAENIYRGLAAYVSERPQELSNSDESIESDPPVVPFYPRHAPSTPVRRAVAAIWPEGDLPPAKAKWFCDLYARNAFSDRTNVYFEPVITVEGQTVVVGGATNHPVLQKTLETMLRQAGLKDVRSEMRLLPEEGRLERDGWFGVCVAPMALDFGRPAEGGPLQSQLLYGEPVFLLDRQDGFYLVQGGDGYVGWVREDCIVPMTRAAFRAYLDKPVAILMRDVAIDTGRIVRGARLRVDGVEGETLRVVLPDGKSANISTRDARLVDDAPVRLARAKAALDLLHVPYLFAGRSSVGLDCSGLVGTICDAYGTVLPRDAAQQFVTGGLVATRWFPEGMQPGDRIYFINETGKIFHTGLSLGGSYFVHSSPPGVQISSFEKGHRLYREHWDVHFLGARRP